MTKKKKPKQNALIRKFKRDFKKVATLKFFFILIRAIYVVLKLLERFWND
jgi:hypothetical protein